MSDEKYPLIETGREEDALFFNLGEFDDRDQACVGHLRGDFGRSGTTPGRIRPPALMDCIRLSRASRPQAALPSGLYAC